MSATKTGSSASWASVPQAAARTRQAAAGRRFSATLNLGLERDAVGGETDRRAYWTNWANWADRTTRAERTYWASWRDRTAGTDGHLGRRTDPDPFTERLDPAAVNRTPDQHRTDRANRADGTPPDATERLDHCPNRTGLYLPGFMD